MVTNKIAEELAIHGQVLRVELGEGIVPRISSVRNGAEIGVFIDSLWGFIRHKTSNEGFTTEAFFFKYRSVPAFHGTCETIALSLAFGKYCGFAVKLDGALLDNALIEQMAFFANTDAGTVLLSFCPFLDLDARPLVMEFDSKKRWRIAAQHLAAAWLHAIWGMKSEN